MRRLNQEKASDPLTFPLELEYTLTTDHIYNALKTSPQYHKNFLKAIIESSVLAALALWFGIWWIWWEDSNAMVFCIAFACLIALVWAVVLTSIRLNCRKFVTGEPVRMTIYEDRICKEDGSVIWLDGTVPCKERNHILIFYTGRAEWTLLPTQNLPQKEDWNQYLLEHTKRPLKKVPKGGRRYAR